MKSLSAPFALPARSLFSRATGFLRRVGFTWTCNPYVGCSFGCCYCYAMFLPQNRRPRDQWGRWFQAKINAVALAQREAPRLTGQALYLASVTDPYLPIERSLELTRGILAALLPYQPRLLLQTRGPLVVRDIDLLQRFACLRVHFSLPTDSEAIRQVFEPKAPPLERRWHALAQLHAAGIPLGICLTPLLPLENVDELIRRLVALQPEVVAVQYFHESQGRFGADTGPQARRLLERYPWTSEDYQRCVMRLRQYLPVQEGEAGFFPPGSAPPSPTSRTIDVAAPHT
jgi:DNA repair photolyase